MAKKGAKLQGETQWPTLTSDAFTLSNSFAVFLLRMLLLLSGSSSDSEFLNTYAIPQGRAEAESFFSDEVAFCDLFPEGFLFYLTISSPCQEGQCTSKCKGRGSLESVNRRHALPLLVVLCLIDLSAQLCLFRPGLVHLASVYDDRLPRHQA